MTGVDIEPACRAYEADGIDVVIGEQGDPAFWERFLGERAPIDVVIDDGSHRSPDQIATLTALLPTLRPGGVYICEDTHDPTNQLCRFVDGLARNLDSFSFRPLENEGMASDATATQRAIASIHHYPYVVVIERTAAAISRFVSPRRGSEWQPWHALQGR